MNQDEFRRYKRCFVDGIELGISSNVRSQEKIKIDTNIIVKDYKFGQLLTMQLEEIYKVSCAQCKATDDKSDLLGVINDIVFLKDVPSIVSRTISSEDENWAIFGNSIHIISVDACSSDSISFGSVKEFGARWLDGSEEKSGISIKMLVVDQFKFWR